MLDEKYLVFKLNDLNEGRKFLDTDAESLEPDEFFVIRRNDVFAAQHLFGYAHIVQTGLELDAIRNFLTPSEREHLRKLADGAMMLGLDWQTHADKKVPD